MQHLGLGLVALEALLNGLVDRLLIAAVAHVDQVDDHQTPDVAQAQLARNLLGRFDVGLQDHLVDVLGAAIAPGVHVDGNQGLGLIDHNIAATGQPDLTREGLVDLLMNADALKDGFRGGRHVMNTALGAA